MAGYTRYGVLAEMLTIVEATQRRFSRNQTSIEAAEGYETAYEAEREKAEIIREMMREERSKMEGKKK